MAVLLFAAVALVGFRFWMRLRESESALEKISERVAVLERLQPIPTVLPTPAPSPIAAPPIVPAAAPVVREAVPAAIPPPPPTLRPQPPTSAAPPADREALESRIGSRWLLYVGVVAIVIGVSYFEKLAIDNHWVNETWRVIQGSVAGLVCIAAGLRIAKKGYRLYGQILAGAGVAILYVSTYAGFNLYHLISHPVAFALMSAITVLGAWLANSQGSQGLALVAVSGGFATPFLLPNGSDAEAALFSYDALLIAGTIALARRRDWPILNIVSYSFTALTFLSWAAVFYTSAKYLTTEFFLTLFCAMFLFALRLAYHSPSVSAKVVRAVLWTAPFGYYVLSLANLFDHSSALLVYLVVLALVGVVSASRTSGWIRLAFWFAVAAPLLVWTGSHAHSSWLVGGLAAWAGVYVLNLAGLFEATLDDEDRFGAADIVLLHVNALAAYFGAYLLIDPIRSVACAPLAAAFALLNLVFAYCVRTRQREQALHFVALAATLLTIAIALQFDGAWITVGWAMEGVLVTWLGLRERRPWLRIGGLALFGAAILRLVALQTMSPSVGETVLLNSRFLSGSFIAALTYLLAYLHHRYGDPLHRHAAVTVALVVGQFLLLAVAVSEIAAFWQRHAPPPAFEPYMQAIAAAFIAGASIVWLGFKRSTDWVRALGNVVVAIASFALLSFQLEPAPLRYVSLMNGRVMASLVGILSLYLLARFYRTLGGVEERSTLAVAALRLSANALTLTMLTSEITAYWHVHERQASLFASTTFAREMMLSLTWAVYATILVIIGLIRKYAPIRYFAMTVFAVTIVKVFAIDLSELDRIYRVLSIIGLGITLLVTSYLYQKLNAEENTGIE